MRRIDAQARVRNLLTLVATGLAAALLVTACGSADSQTEDVKPVGPQAKPPGDVQELLDRAEEARPAQAQLQKELREASVRTLVRRLDAESKQEREPFNSVAYREIRRRGEKIGDELAEEIKRQDRPSFLGVLALRLVNRAAYRSFDADLAVDVLVDRLETNKYFNAWGLPHLYWEDGARAVIEQGSDAVEPLRALLDDRRRAPVYGEEEALESDRYRYRVKDYAFELLNEIEDKKVDLPRSPSGRDKLIEDYQADNG